MDASTEGRLVIFFEQLLYPRGARDVELDETGFAKAIFDRYAELAVSAIYKIADLQKLCSGEHTIDEAAHLEKIQHLRDESLYGAARLRAIDLVNLVTRLVQYERFVAEQYKLVQQYETGSELCEGLGYMKTLYDFNDALYDSSVVDLLPKATAAGNTAVFIVDYCGVIDLLHEKYAHIAIEALRLIDAQYETGKGWADSIGHNITTISEQVSRAIRLPNLVNIAYHEILRIPLDLPAADRSTAKLINPCSTCTQAGMDSYMCPPVGRECDGFPPKGPKA